MRNRKFLESILGLGVTFLTVISSCGVPERGGGGGDPPSPCGLGCGRGFLCQTNGCVVDPTGLWSVAINDGSVATRKLDGSLWDGDASPPDPFVCLTLNGRRTCTTAIQDTYSPTWNQRTQAATATALQAGVFVEYVDEDAAVDDPICQGTLAVTAADFARGRWEIICTKGIGQISTLLLPP